MADNPQNLPLLAEAGARVQQLWQAAQASGHGNQLLFDNRTSIDTGRKPNTNVRIRYHLADSSAQIIVQGCIVPDARSNSQRLLVVGQVSQEDELFAVAMAGSSSMTYDVWTVADQFENTIGKVRKSIINASLATRSIGGKGASKISKRKHAGLSDYEADEDSAFTESEDEVEDIEDAKCMAPMLRAAKPRNRVHGARGQAPQAHPSRRSARIVESRKTYPLPNPLDEDEQDCNMLGVDRANRAPSSDIFDSVEVAVQPVQPPQKIHAASKKDILTRAHPTRVVPIASTLDHYFRRAKAPPSIVTSIRSTPVTTSKVHADPTILTEVAPTPPYWETPGFTQSPTLTPSRCTSARPSEPSIVEPDKDDQDISPNYDPRLVTFVFVDTQGHVVTSAPLTQCDDVGKLFDFAKVAKVLPPDRANALRTEINGTGEPINLFDGRDDFYEEMMMAIKSDSCWNVKSEEGARVKTTMRVDVTRL